MTKTDSWKTLYRIGAIAALMAGLVFRRNLGAEVTLLAGIGAIPDNINAWFELLQTKPLIGLSFLAFFDLFNYALVGLLFLGLAVRLWLLNKSLATMALVGGLVGVTLNLASNISLTIFALSQRHAASVAAAQKEALLAAGQMILARNDPLSGIPGTGGVVSLILVALAGILFSIMLRPSHRATAIFGLMAGVCDLAYCLTYPLTAVAPVYLLLAAAGLFWMLWHILIARALWGYSKE